MAYTNLINAISAVVKTNGNGEITGQNMQDVLKSIVNTIGANATFAGIATPATVPPSTATNANVFYIASQNGTYSNFGGIVVADEVVILSNASGTWAKSTIDASLTAYKSQDRGYNALSPSDVEFLVRSNGSIDVIFAHAAINILDEYLTRRVLNTADLTYTIPPYNYLIADINTLTCSVTANYNRTDKQVVLALNNGGVIDFGILAPMFLRKSVVKNVENTLTAYKSQDRGYNALSPSDVEFSVRSNGSIDVIFAHATTNILDEYLTQRVLTTADLTYTIPPYNYLIADINTLTCSVTAKYNRTDKQVVLALNNGGVIDFGILAPMFLRKTMLLSPLRNKKCLFVGDSITQQARYIASLKALTGLIDYNRGLSGTTVAKSTIPSSFCERLDLDADNRQYANDAGFPSDAMDYVFIFGGINDWGRVRNQTFGSLDTLIDNTTFCGALRYLYKGLRTKYPDAKIIVLNLLHTYSTTTFANWTELNYADNDETKAITIAVNQSGKTLADYRNAIADCAKMFGFPVIDLYNVGFSATNTSDLVKYYDDGLHPNNLGGSKIADYIVAQLKAII